MLFVEAGIEVALEAVACRAGVGIATLYRHFPDRRALVEAVAIDAMAVPKTRPGPRVADEPDGFAAFRRYMHRAFDVCAPAIMPLLDDEVRRAPGASAATRLKGTSSSSGRAAPPGRMWPRGASLTFRLDAGR